MISLVRVELFSVSYFEKAYYGHIPAVGYYDFAGLLRYTSRRPMQVLRPLPT